MSGLTKAVRGGFPSGLAGELRESSKGAAGWFGASSTPSSCRAPSSSTGRMIGEIAIGVSLVFAAAPWQWRWERLPEAGRAGVLAATALASLGAISWRSTATAARTAPGRPGDRPAAPMRPAAALLFSAPEER